MRTSRSQVLLPALALLLLACGGEEQRAATEDAEAEPIAGMYQVRGTTVAVEGGSQRSIGGTLILASEGNRYTATFNLTTTYPGADQALPAEVIGKGEGVIEGRTLKGTARTQLVMATVPGVDPGFAFVPRMVSARIASNTVATIAADGSVAIQIENQAEPGSRYAPTRTTLHGRRISPAGIGGALAEEDQ